MMGGDFREGKENNFVWLHKDIAFCPVHWRVTLCDFYFMRFVLPALLRTIERTKLLAKKI